MRNLIIAAVGATLLSGPALANITIFSSPGAVQPSENVLFNLGDPVGNVARGSTNRSGTEVVFLGSEPLATPPRGQARLTGTDGDLSELSFALANPLLGFTEVRFNLFRQTGSATSVDLFFSDQFGNLFTDTFSIGSGSNVFSALASDGQLITNVRFALNGDISDVRQIRVGGLDAGIIPEPATWAMLIIGFGLIGASARRRRVGAALVN